MSNSIFYRKLIVSPLAIVSLAFGIECISFGQLPISHDIKVESTRYVVWIVTEESSGSGVLIDKDLRLVVTNAHVVDNNKEVQVFFAVRDSSGDIVRARPFYKNKEHQSTLKRLGYVTRGRVVAKNPESEPDLALIELDGFPETSSVLSPLTSINYSNMQKDEASVYILGHPKERPLWQAKAGHFIKYDGEDLQIFADAYYGNSGGPVLNKKNRELIGITRGINEDKGITFAVPASAIIDLFLTFRSVWIFSIYNNTEFPMSYEVQWEDDGGWKEEILLPKEEKPHAHATPYKIKSRVYPKIRFQDTKNDEVPSESVKRLETKFREFGRGITDVKAHIEINDALRYQFGFNSETEKISLEKSKLVQAFAIHNATKIPVFFEYKWHEDDEWTGKYVEQGTGWRFVKESEKVSTSYPRIRVAENPDRRKYPEEGWVIETQIEHSSISTDISDNLKSSNPRRYYFNYDSKDKKFNLRQGSNVSGRSLANWLLLIAPWLIIGLLIPVAIIPVVDIFFPKRHIFSLQNNTEAAVNYHVKWTKKDDWKPNSLEPGKSWNHWWTGLFKKKPQIRFDQTVNEEKRTKEWNLETKARRFFGQNVSTKISRDHARNYHFDYDPETNELTLYRSENK